MNNFDSERSKLWNTSSDHTPLQARGTTTDSEAPWKNFGTSMNAIAFGFIATAILISMFLIMAIFEHLFRPNPSSPTSQEMRANRPSESDKIGNQQIVRKTTAYASEYPVVMPGHKYPTYIAQPAPLPCPREEIYWPNHQHLNLECP